MPAGFAKVASRSSATVLMAPPIAVALADVNGEESIIVCSVTVGSLSDVSVWLNARLEKNIIIKLKVAM